MPLSSQVNGAEDVADQHLEDAEGGRHLGNIVVWEQARKTISQVRQELDASNES